MPELSLKETQRKKCNETQRKNNRTGRISRIKNRIRKNKANIC
jgi:hypothetical protein